MDDARVERVARALCRHDGRDPDAMSTRTGDVVININRNDPPHPRWHEYTDEARKFIVAHDALVSR